MANVFEVGSNFFNGLSAGWDWSKFLIFTGIVIAVLFTAKIILFVLATLLQISELIFLSF